MSNKNIKNSLQSIDFTPSEDSSKRLILLHGYGANAQDLAPLAEHLIQGRSCWGHAPDAPETPRELAPFGGRAWFQLDMQMLQQRAADPSGPLLDEDHVKRLQKCVDEKLLPWLDSLCSSGEELCLGGFSQGSMLCLDLFLRHRPEYIKSLVLFSGAWPYPSSLKNVKAEGASPPIFVSHGVQDPVLAIRHSRRMVEELRARGFSVQSNEFSGGHEIPPPILDQSLRFVSSSFFHSS